MSGAKRWLRRLRGAVGMGLTWAVGWTVVGMTLMILADRLVPGFDADVVDLWIPVFAYPGFLTGVTFSTVLGIAERRRKLHELSIRRCGLWGAIGGALVALLPAVPLGIGLATTGAPPRLVVMVVSWIVGPIALLGAGSAAGSLALARRADKRELLEAGESPANGRLAADETTQLLGSRG